MKLKILSLLVLMLFLIGCQKHGLSIEIPKNYQEKKQAEVETEISEKGETFEQVPTTRAVIMKDGVFDLSTISPRELSLDFANFRIKLYPDDNREYFKIIVYEPKDYHNGYTSESLLNPAGSILGQVFIQRQNGLTTSVDEFNIHYLGEE